jgi:hypothetical protein
VALVALCGASVALVVPQGLGEQAAQADCWVVLPAWLVLSVWESEQAGALTSWENGVPATSATTACGPGRTCSWKLAPAQLSERVSGPWFLVWELLLVQASERLSAPSMV